MVLVYFNREAQSSLNDMVPAADVVSKVSKTIYGSQAVHPVHTVQFQIWFLSFQDVENRLGSWRFNADHVVYADTATGAW